MWVCCEYSVILIIYLCSDLRTIFHRRNKEFWDHQSSFLPWPGLVVDVAQVFDQCQRIYSSHYYYVNMQKYIYHQRWESFFNVCLIIFLPLLHRASRATTGNEGPQVDSNHHLFCRSSLFIICDFSLPHGQYYKSMSRSYWLLYNICSNLMFVFDLLVFNWLD